MNKFIILAIATISTAVFAGRDFPYNSGESYRAYEADREKIYKSLNNPSEKSVRTFKPIKKNSKIKNEFEFNYSLYTYHFTNPENVGLKFENKVSSDGRLINNPVFGFSIKENVSDEAYRNNYFFGGVDSIGSPIYGYIRTTGFISSWNTYVGFAYGGYFMNNAPWVKKGILHTNMVKLNEQNSIVPIIGIEISQKISLGDGVFLKINNLFTPVLSNHNIGFGFEF